MEGLVVDLDADGKVVGFDIDHASAKLDLSPKCANGWKNTRDKATPGLRQIGDTPGEA